MKIRGFDVKTFNEADRLHREQFDAENEGKSLEEKLNRATSHIAWTTWWYGQRWARLRELVRGTDIEEKACCVMANGTAEVCEPPTATQQMQRLQHTLCKSRVALRECLETAQGQEGDAWRQLEELCETALRPEF